MIRPSPEAMKALATIARTQPAVVSWLADWYSQELKQLPTVTTRVEVAQGRCQVLKELYELVTKAPEHVA